MQPLTPSLLLCRSFRHRSRHVLVHNVAPFGGRLAKMLRGVAGLVEAVSLLSRLSSPGAGDEHGSAKTNLLKFSKLRGISQKEKAE